MSEKVKLNTHRLQQILFKNTYSEDGNIITGAAKNISSTYPLIAKLELGENEVAIVYNCFLDSTLTFNFLPKYSTIVFINSNFENVEFLRVSPNDEPLRLYFLNCDLARLDYSGCTNLGIVYYENSSIQSLIFTNSEIDKLILNKVDKLTHFEVNGTSTISILDILSQPQLDRLVINPGTKIKSINIINSNLGTLSCMSSVHLSHIKISENSNINNVNFNLSHSSLSISVSKQCTINSIDFYDSKIQELKISDFTNIKRLVFSGSALAKKLLIESGCNIKKLSVKQNSSLGGLSLTLVSYITELDIKSGSSVSDLSISTSSIINRCKFNNCTVDTISSEVGSTILLFISKQCIGTSWSLTGISGKFEIESVNCKRITISKSDLSTLYIKNDSEFQLFVSSSQIFELRFNSLYFDKKMFMSISNTLIHSIYMYQTTIIGILQFRNIKIANSQNYKVITGNTDLIKSTYNLSPVWTEYIASELNMAKVWFAVKVSKHSDESPTFTLAESSLGETEFLEFDFANIDIKFKNSKIFDVFITGGTSPHPNKVLGSNKLNPDLEHKESFFNQLKISHHKQGNVVEALKSQAYASRFRFNRFNLNERYSSNWIVDYLNKHSNDFGTNWFRALKFILGSATIGFIFYNSFLDKPKYEFVYYWCTDFIGDFAKFILPIHKSNFMCDNPSPLSELIDVVFRIIIGYGIYQFIAAFRKYSKK